MNIPRGSSRRIALPILWLSLIAFASQACNDQGEPLPTPTPEAVCGNGLVEAGEVCDDGNNFDGDGCNHECSSDETCGNGVVDPNELCDDGNTLDGDGCDSDCASDESCGNGILDAGEQCDDGNNADGDGCSADCRSDESCGNGVTDGGEACDDGNNVSGDGCAADCSSDESCGNGILDPGEQCDDGNTLPGDGCDGSCMGEGGSVCGDGILDLGEQCDDGNNSNGDGCDALCNFEAFCGNGIVDPGEACDDANGNNDDGCMNDCMSLPWRGGVGGTLNPATYCGAGTVAVGVKMMRGDWADRVWLICREDLGVNGLGAETETPSFGGGGGSPFEFRCDTNQPDGIMVGQQIWTEGSPYVRSAGAICERLSDFNNAGGVHGATWNEGNGGSATGAATLHQDLCPDGSVITGYRSRTGAWTDGMQMLCGAP